MNDLQIQISKQGEIQFNLDGLKKELSEIANRYEGVVVTEQTIPIAKKDLAELRKTSKEIEDRRKAVKKEWAKPYETFEKEVKTALEIINKPISEIDKQIKEFEIQAKAEKEQHVRELYKAEVADRGYEEYLPFANIFDERWLNKTTEDREILFDLNSLVTQVKMDMDAIDALNTEFKDEVIKAYKTSGNQLSVAIKRNSDLLSAKQLAKEKADEEAQAKIEAERKAREEAEQRAIEAEKKIEEVKEEPINPLPFDVETVRFVISGQENIDRVREFLTFSEIEFEEEVG